MSELKNKRRIFLLLTLPQTAAVFFALQFAELHAMIDFDRFLHGKALPPVTDLLVRMRDVTAWVHGPQLALAVCATHCFLAYALIWNCGDPQKIQLRWTVFSLAVWAILFFGILILALSTATPFIPIVRLNDPTTWSTPERLPSQAEPVADIGLAVWFIFLAAAAFVVYRMDHFRRESENASS